MGLIDLTEMEILVGCTSLISALIATILGLKIAFKYSEYKRKEFITAGFSTILMMSGQIMLTVSFLAYVLFDLTVSVFSFVLFSITGALIALICWIYTISILLYPNSVKRNVTIYIMVCLFWEIFLIYFLFTDIANVATESGKFDFQINFYTLLMAFFSLMTLIITMSLFTHKSLKSNDVEFQWRGKFLLTGAISFIIGMVFDMRFATLPITVVIARIIIISSTFFLYIGWLLPKRISNWLIKEDHRRSEENEDQKSDVLEFLKLIKSRPEKFTEKEITFFRERKICIVCKGKVLRFNSFICECDALYCEKCARMLSDLDNACWVCNAPFDESKPSKPYKKEEEEIHLKPQKL